MRKKKKRNLDRLLQHKNRDKFNANSHKESISSWSCYCWCCWSNTINSYLDMARWDGSGKTTEQTLSTTYLSGSLSTAVLLNSIQALMSCSLYPHSFARRAELSSCVRDEAVLNLHKSYSRSNLFAGSCEHGINERTPNENKNIHKLTL